MRRVSTKYITSDTREPIRNTNASLIPSATATAPKGRNCAMTERNSSPIRTTMMMMVSGSMIARSLFERDSISAAIAASPVTYDVMETPFSDLMSDIMSRIAATSSIRGLSPSSVV